MAGGNLAMVGLITNEAKTMKRILVLLTVLGMVSMAWSQTAERETALKVPRDSWTGALLTIDYAHFDIHEGGHFYVHNYSGSLGSGDTIMVTIDVPDSLGGAPTVKNLHLVWNFAPSAGAANLKVYEAQSDTGAVATGGSLITTFNNNRAYKSAAGDSSIATWLLTPTITGYGTQIWAARVGASQQEGGDYGHESELILKPGYTYIFRYESNAASNFINYMFGWYEHTPIKLKVRE
jgi:hypothetical protein